MIRRVQGTVFSRDSENSFLEVAVKGLGITLRIAASRRLLERAEPKRELEFPTHLIVGGSGPELFGFADVGELKVFEFLLTVPRVGPRLGQRIISELSPQRIAAAVNNEDEKTLRTVSGVGARAASRIVVDLKGKLSEVEFGGIRPAGVPDSDSHEALAALESLGYSRAAAADALARGVEPGMSVEDQIRAALAALI